jgi:hypothetical protein
MRWRSGFGVRAGQGEQGPQILLDGFRPEPLMCGEQPAPGSPGRVALAAAPATGFADDSLADLGEPLDLEPARTRH